MDSYDPAQQESKRQEVLQSAFQSLGFNKSLSKLKYLLVKNSKQKSAESIIEAIKSDIQYLKQLSKGPVPAPQELKAPEPEPEPIKVEASVPAPQELKEPEPDSSMPKKNSEPQPEPPKESEPAPKAKAERSKGCKRGSKEEVYNGVAEKTAGGLCKADLCVNSRGKIVSKKKHELGQQNFKKIAKKDSSNEQ